MLKINKINARLIKLDMQENVRKTQIININNERGNTSIDPKSINRTVS